VDGHDLVGIYLMPLQLANTLAAWTLGIDPVIVEVSSMKHV